MMQNNDYISYNNNYNISYNNNNIIIYNNNDNNTWQCLEPF